MIPQPQSRREFLQSAARATLLFSVAWIGAFLFRRQVSCQSPGQCSTCQISGGCSLPWKETKK